MSWPNKDLDLSDFWLVSSVLRASYLVFVCLFDVADDDEVFVFDDVSEDIEMAVAVDLGERLSFDFDDKQGSLSAKLLPAF